MQDLKTIAVFFSLTIFGMIFLVLIAIDANRLKNTIQIVSDDFIKGAQQDIKEAELFA